MAVKATFNSILRFMANYLGHPIFMPLYAYCISWVMADSARVQGAWINFLVVFCLLIAAPLLIYPVLLKAGKIKSIHLKSVQERIWPLGINLVLWGGVVLYFNLIAPKLGIVDAIPQFLNSFYLGGTLCVLGALISARIHHKSSLHMMGISGLVTHLILAQIYFDLAHTFYASTLIWGFGLGAIIGIGIVRYKSKAHTPFELFTGLCLGMSTQLIAFLAIPG